MTSTTDFTTLGRLGTSGGRTPRTRRGRPATRSSARRPARAPLPVPTLVGLAVGGVLVLLLAVGVLVGSQVQGMPQATAASPSVDPALEADLMTGQAVHVPTGAMRLVPGGGAAPGSVEAPAAFAAVEDVAVHLPLAAARGVVFTEADTAAALPLAPVGQMAANANPDGYVPTRTTVGPDYVVAPPATGVRPATGMAVLLADHGSPVLAPVQGVVDAVTPVTTADGERDWVIRIAPAGRPDLHVVVRHVDAPAVAPGDAVTVGRTSLGVVRAGAVLDAGTNPEGLPGAAVHVQPAVTRGLGAADAPPTGDG